MARRIPGDEAAGLATVDLKAGKADGTWDLYVRPSDERLKEGGIDPSQIGNTPILMVKIDQPNARVRVFPHYTRPEPDGSFKPKHEQIKAISFDLPLDIARNANLDADDADSALDYQPTGMTRDPNYGLGVKKEYRFILQAVASLTDKQVLYIGLDEPLPDEFRVPPEVYTELIDEIDRIDHRAQVAENEVKSTTAYNVIATNNGIDTRPFRLGRHKVRQLIQNFAIDPSFRSAGEQEQLIAEIGSVAEAFAEKAPKAAEKLVSDIQLTRLEIAIQEFEKLMRASHNETKWQEFFEKDPFLLSFAFGYPVSFVKGQPYLGGRKIDGKGEKIGDFLFKNNLNNNAALIEIKKPHTPLCKAYRNGVYGPHDELSGGITQALEQRYHLVSNFAQHMKDNEWWAENAVADYEIDCVLVVGLMPADKDQRRSFQLYRKNSHGVRIITFDEVLAQLKRVAEYLRGSTSS